MNPRLWQAIALAIGALLFASVVCDTISGLVGSVSIGFVGTPGRHPGWIVVKTITAPRAADHPVRAGDEVHLTDLSAANQFRFVRSRPGDRFDFAGTTAAGAPLRFTATMTTIGPASPLFWVYELVRLALVAVGLLVVVRRPNDEVARILVALFFSLAAALEMGAPFYPVWLVALGFVVARFSQVYTGYASLALAVAFPRRSERGVRRWLDRVNAPYFALCLLSLFSAYTLVIVLLVPSPPWLQALGIIETLLYFAAITMAFVTGAREATCGDRKRVQWVGWTLAVGFSGTLIALALLVLKAPAGWAYEWLGLSFLAIPFGLGYAIVRHRVVDIGFVVNRALVFAGVSGIVVIAFGVLEWVLSNVFVRVSHITSTSLELALALVLGFSLRTIHAKVDSVVDDLFFRDRHAAERALHTFARDVAFVTDPRVAVARAHAALLAHTGAANAAVYVADARSAIRVDPAENAAPDVVDVDDPALVRLRATRAPLALREVGSALAGEWAFPMCVRDAVTGVVVLGPTASGEAYAPDELATIETVALALGNALDALQTAALKAEVARVLLDGAPVEELRRTVEFAGWARGVAPQPAGSLPGLRE